MSSIFYLFSHQVLDELYLVVLDLLIFSELAIFAGIQISVSDKQEFLSL